MTARARQPQTGGDRPRRRAGAGRRCLFSGEWLRKNANLEDCLMSGRSNCAPIEARRADVNWHAIARHAVIPDRPEARPEPMCGRPPVCKVGSTTGLVDCDHVSGLCVRSGGPQAMCGRPPCLQGFGSSNGSGRLRSCVRPVCASGGPQAQMGYADRVPNMNTMSGIDGFPGGVPILGSTIAISLLALVRSRRRAVSGPLRMQ